jgi:hypothetical protein
MCSPRLRKSTVAGLVTGIEISVSLEVRDLLFLDGLVEFPKISMENVQIVRKWMFGSAYALQ